MKKIIAISVMFALITGAVFADTSIGGGFGYQLDVLRGDNGKDWANASGGYVVDTADSNGETVLGTPSLVKSQTNFKSATVDFNFSGEGYGGRVRLYAAGSKGWWGDLPFAFAWWQPAPIFRFQLGHNPDGNFGAAQITGWGFNGSAQDYVATDNDSGGGTSYVGYSNANSMSAFQSMFDDKFQPKIASVSRNRAWRSARSYGFYGGYSNVAALISLYPVDIFTVNLVLPFSFGHADQTNEFADILKRVHANFVIKTGDIGTARLTFQGQGGSKSTDQYQKDENGEWKVKAVKSYGSTGDIWASFYLSGIQNLGLDVGIGYGLGYVVGEGDAAVTMNPGLQFGLGVRYVMDDFGIKFRIGGKMMEGASFKEGSDTFTYTAPTQIGFGILPYYNLGALTAYLNAGFGMYTAASATGGGHTMTIGGQYSDWYFNPYVKVPAGGLTFWAGIKVIGDGRLGHAEGSDTFSGTAKENGSTMEWQIPIGISVGF